MGEYIIGLNGVYMFYPAERIDAGPLIQPCECRGDVSTVHHECLRRWLLQVREAQRMNLWFQFCWISSLILCSFAFSMTESERDR